MVCVWLWLSISVNWTLRETWIIDCDKEVQLQSFLGDGLFILVAREIARVTSWSPDYMIRTTFQLCIWSQRGSAFQLGADGLNMRENSYFQPWKSLISTGFGKRNSWYEHNYIPTYGPWKKHMRLNTRWVHRLPRQISNFVLLRNYWEPYWCIGLKKELCFAGSAVRGDAKASDQGWYMVMANSY
jgi:hypothetical protein